MTNALLLLFGILYWRISYRVHGPWNEELSLVHVENLTTLKSRAFFTAWTAGLTAVSARVGLVFIGI
jgi:hypothetical protein